MINNEYRFPKIKIVEVRSENTTLRSDSVAYNNRILVKPGISGSMPQLIQELFDRERY